MARQEVGNVRGVLYRDKRGRWRETVYNEATGRWRGGQFASPPAPGDFYRDRQNRLRVATLNKRGQLSSRLVRKTRGPAASRYADRLATEWSRVAGVRKSRIHVLVETHSRPKGEKFTTIDVGVSRKSAEVTNGEMADVLNRTQADQVLVTDMNSQYPGAASAIRFRHLETGMADWVGLANTDGFRACIDRTIAALQRELGTELSQSEAFPESAVLLFHLILFHQ